MQGMLLLIHGTVQFPADLDVVPSNMLLGLTRPSYYLPACMIIWGVVSGCSGAVQNFAGS
jgi:hypothetical protein